MTKYFISKEENEELMKVFKSMDLNGDGQLEKSELLQAYSKIYNSSNLEEEVDKIMDIVDTDKCGYISY